MPLELGHLSGPPTTAARAPRRAGKKNGPGTGRQGTQTHAHMHAHAHTRTHARPATRIVLPTRVHFPGEDSGSERGSDLPKSTQQRGEDGVQGHQLGLRPQKDVFGAPRPKRNGLPAPALSPPRRALATWAQHPGSPLPHAAFEKVFQGQRSPTSEYSNNSFGARKVQLILLFFKAIAELGKVVRLIELP